MGTLYNKETISNAIHTKWAGKTVHFVKETDSTNIWAKALAKEGAAHGTLAVTEFQSAGRGTLRPEMECAGGQFCDDDFASPAGIFPQYASMLTLVMGLSVAQAAGRLGLTARIKWPNDVVVSRKKICGILTEMGMRVDKIGYVAIGVGINVNMMEFPKELADKATSLCLEAGREFDRNQVIARVMETFEENYEKFVQTCDLSCLKADYEKALANLGEPVRVLDMHEPYEGICLGINDGGELLVKKTDGTVDAVSAGEVSVRGLYSYV